jgi:hypothetical protein
MEVSILRAWTGTRMNIKKDEINIDNKINNRKILKVIFKKAKL